MKFHAMYVWCFPTLNYQLCLLLIIFDNSNCYYFLTSRICSQQPPFLHIFKQCNIGTYMKHFQHFNSLKFHWNLWNFISNWWIKFHFQNSVALEKASNKCHMEFKMVYRCQGYWFVGRPEAEIRLEGAVRKRNNTAKITSIRFFFFF